MMPAPKTADYYLALPPCKANAGRAITWAINNNLLHRPNTCEDCKKAPKRAIDGRSLIQGHHYLGYDHPFDVRWLCVKCHAKYDPRASGERSGTCRHSDEKVKEAVLAFRAGEPSASIQKRLNISRATRQRWCRGERKC